MVVPTVDILVDILSSNFFLRKYYNILNFLSSLYLIIPVMENPYNTRYVIMIDIKVMWVNLFLMCVWYVRW